MSEKPNIQSVCDAFHRFRVSMLPSQMPPVREPAKWKQKQAENQAALKAELDEMGLGQLIDWTDET